MGKFTSCHSVRVFLMSVIFATSAVFAAPKDWQEKKVNWRAGNGRQIKAIHYPADKPVPTRANRGRSRHGNKQSYESADQLIATHDSQTAVTVNTIESPPVDGFVPWIIVTATNERLEELEYNAVPTTSVQGSFLSGSSDIYTVGLFDTGASAHVFGYDSANTLGLNGTYLTDNVTTISGVTGSVDAWVSQPVGIYIAGLNAADPNGSTYDPALLVGETNTSVLVGQQPFGVPDLPTAIGSPMSVFYTTWIRNDNPISLDYNSETYIGPDITVTEHEDSSIPEYSSKIPLELRPLGGMNVSYIATGLGDDILNPDFSPTTPSIITGNSSQSLFFVHSVDVIDGTYSSIDRDRFMLDTGAQVTVIGSRVAARLGVDPANPEFEVEIMGVTGDVSMMPGFYIDSLKIPALGSWLEATNVPVVLLDVASPEGGTLDGIIGMNLFVDCNLILRGGGLFLQDDPVLEFEFIDQAAVSGDIAPTGGDGQVDMLDLTTLASSWLSMQGDFDWNASYDIAPASYPDGQIDLLDFSVIANNWMAGY